MSGQEKYWGCTPVVTEHMEARMKASREYAKMASNDDETPEQRAGRAKDFQCGAIWEEGFSKKHGWYPASEPPKERDVEVVMLVDVSSPQFTNAPLIRVPIFGRYINGWPEGVNVKWWCYPPKED